MPANHPHPSQRQRAVSMQYGAYFGVGKSLQGIEGLAQIPSTMQSQVFDKPGMQMLSALRRTRAQIASAIS
jgi:hypothetical protein